MKGRLVRKKDYWSVSNPKRLPPTIKKMKHTTADIKWSRKIRDRDGKCLVCGKSDKRLNAHHLVPRQIIKFRHELNNGISLCVTHHNFGTYSAHKNPIWFYNWLKLNHPDLLKIAELRL